MQDLKLTAALCAALTVAAPAMADTISFATTNVETSPLNTEFLVPWAEKMSESDALDVDIRHGPTIANHTNFYDRALDGVVDIVWGLSVFNPGKFTNSLVMTIPFFVESSEQASLAACRMYKNGDFGDDFEGVKPLLFAQFPQSYLHTTDTPIENGLASMDGLKVIATAPPTIEITKANGGIPLSVTITEAYEALQRGTADAMINSFTAFSTFRLGEQLNHHYAAPLGGALAFTFMSQESYDGLSDAAKAVIDENSDCEVSRQFGAWIDKWNLEEQEAVISQEGHTFSEMSPEEVDALIAEIGDEITASFASNFPGGQPLVDALMRELEAAK